MDLSAYVGIPWLERGRDRDGCDCWGLLAMAYREQLGVSLPSFRDDYQTLEDADAVVALIEGHMGPWHEVEVGRERSGDALLMTIAGRPRHVGVIASPGLVLHIEIGAGSLIESYRGFRLHRRIAGFYRHEALA
jgi:cell wall-associated NlpC family hydrolase